jgi:transcriptional regulator with XRE-family HTH domain
MVYIIAMSSPQVDAEIRRLASLLEAVLRYRGPGGGLRVGARALERQLGWSAGTLSRVLQGKIELKVRHLLDLLEVLRVSPEDFFELAYQPRARQGTAQDLLTFLESRGLRGGPRLVDKPESAISDDDLDERILAALRRLSLNLPKQGGEPGAGT